MAKKFKPHKMFSKTGIMKMANTIAQHLALKKKGYNHKKKQDMAKKKKKSSCWKGYVAKGKKKSPSGKKTKGGKPKMVNNCVPRRSAGRGR